MKKHNFSAGPAILPAPVLKEASKAALNYNGIGLSLLELSHRGPEFTAIIEEANALMKEIIGLPDNYHVLWLSGGASTQFFMAPFNLLNEGETAAYVNTGTWADKAIKEAKGFGEVNVLASSKEQNYNHIPKGYKIPKDAKYLHLTSNNTIFGTQLHRFPKSPVPLVCDRPCPVSATRTSSSPPAPSAAVTRISPPPCNGSMPCLMAFSTRVISIIGGKAWARSSAGTATFTFSRDPIRSCWISR